LFYRDGYEIDYPEDDYGGTISAYTHPGGANFGTAAKWSDWHTTDIEWTAGAVKFYLDGVLIGTATDKVPSVNMSWILQNESSIRGPFAAPGASAQLDIAWIACYAPVVR
jgi:beta-glucanase (GH16 family)